MNSLSLIYIIKTNLNEYQWIDLRIYVLVWHGIRASAIFGFPLLCSSLFCLCSTFVVGWHLCQIPAKSHSLLKCVTALNESIGSICYLEVLWSELGSKLLALLVPPRTRKEGRDSGDRGVALAASGGMVTDRCCLGSFLRWYTDRSSPYSS